MSAKLSDKLAGLCAKLRGLRKTSRGADYRVRELIEQMASRADACHSIEMLVQSGAWPRKVRSPYYSKPQHARHD